MLHKASRKSFAIVFIQSKLMQVLGKFLLIIFTESIYVTLEFVNGTPTRLTNLWTSCKFLLENENTGQCMCTPTHGQEIICCNVMLSKIEFSHSKASCCLNITSSKI